MILPSLMDILRERLGDGLDGLTIPPPVFETLQGEMLALDAEAWVLTVRFPVLPAYLNPYGSLQGGMVAAAVDNTLGPLSMLVAPPNVTRRLEMKYSRPVTPELDHILVTGHYLGREGRTLAFHAEVRDPAGMLLARGRAEHFVLDESPR
jgi:acyl-coenzyme A thioesterase PaaI-like protein